MAKSAQTYPDLARLISKGLADSKRAGHPYTIRDASKKLGDISTATFAAWKGGYRAPRVQNISALAELFYPNDSDKRSTFVSELMAAISPKSGDDHREDSLTQPLHLGAVLYEPMALPTSQGRGFLDDFLRRLIIYGDLRPANRSDDELLFNDALLGDVGEQLDAGVLDLVAGVMSTVDRNKKLRFFSTPISLPVNAVMLKSHFEEFKGSSTTDPLPDTTAQFSLQKYLTPEDPDPKSVKLHPIVRPTEVGGLYCRLGLGLRTDEQSDEVTLASDYTAQAYLDALENHVIRQGKYPVIVVDELMCLNILSEAKGKCRLIFNLTDQDALMPRYSVGFTVAKYRKNLISYLEDVLPIYLRADSNYLLHRYKRLYDELCRNAGGALGDNHPDIKPWAFRTLSLNEDDGNFDLGYSVGWKALLRRVRQLIDKKSRGSGSQGLTETT